MTQFLEQMNVYILPFLLVGSVGGCALMTSGMEQRATTCSYDQAWDAAIEVVKDRAADTNDKDAGLIVTHWLEIPCNRDLERGFPQGPCKHRPKD